MIRFVAAVALLWSVPALGAPDVEGDEDRLRAATVTLVPPRCAGVLLGDGGLALTAAHCLADGERRLRVTLEDGREVGARVIEVDAERDLALLKLRRRAGMGLEIAADLPDVGEIVLFAGRSDEAQPLQLASVEDLRPCPTLPGVPAAIFTTIDGRKGDSGAPVVDEDLQIIGIVHGGATCNILTPVNGWVSSE